MFFITCMCCSGCWIVWTRCIQHETTVFTVCTQWFWLLRECLMSTVELLWCQSKVPWVKRCPYFADFLHISVSDIVCKVDILPICDCLLVSQARPFLFFGNTDHISDSSTGSDWHYGEETICLMRQSQQLVSISKKQMQSFLNKHNLIVKWSLINF